MKPSWIIALILILGFLSGYSIGKSIKKMHGLGAQVVVQTAQTELHQYETSPIRPNPFTRKSLR